MPEDTSMSESPVNPFVHHVRQLIGGDPATALSDRQLLERFLASRDEVAVEVLVRRYGPLVLGVCRRVLHNAHAAEDAFQAAFLVLVRKAPSLLSCERLGGFLYRVAYRLALRARANEARRQRREALAARNRLDGERPATAENELLVALEEELHRLPEKHRTPLVLCYLEGKTSEQAAQLLGCPRGSMGARLEQARERLRERLAQRGYPVGAAGVAAVLSTATAGAAVPLPLLCNTARAAVWFAGEQAGSAGFVSSAAVALARSACRATLLDQMKVAAALLLITALLGTGATLLLRAASSPPVPPPLPQVIEGPGELPRGAIARMGTTRLRHGDAVFFAACTPDGKRLVTAGRDKTVRLWDLATGKEIRRFDWPPEQADTRTEPSADGLTQRWERQLWDDLALACQAALSPDGQTVAASRGGVVCLWETSTGKKLRQLQTAQKRLDQLAFSADGKQLLTLGPGHATAVWEVATGECLRRREGQPVDRFRVSEYAAVMEQVALVSPGWKYLAYREQAPNDGLWSIKIKDLATGKVLTQIHTGDGRAPFTFTADEKTLVWASFRGGIVFSDVTTGKERRRLADVRARYDVATNFAFSPDAKSLAVTWVSHKIELWDLKSGKETGRVARPTLRPGDQVGEFVRPALTYAPDGKTLLCSLGEATLRRFQAGTGKEIPWPGSTQRAPVSTVALSADGKVLWTHGSGDPVRCWDPASGKEIARREVPGHATHVAFAADGRLAFAEGKTITLRDAADRQTRQIAAAELPLVALALAPDGKVLATRSHYNLEVYLWDAQGKQRRTLAPSVAHPGGRGNVLTESMGVVTPDLVFSPDGRCLAGAGPRRQLCLWDVARGTLLWEQPLRAGQVIERFAFSPGGLCLASVNADSTVTLIDTLTGTPRGRLGEADPSRRRLHLTYSFDTNSALLGTRWHVPVCLAFSADGRYLAVAKDTPAIQVWDVLSGRKVGRLAGHEGGVVSLLFSADGKRLFSGGRDTTVLTWDLTRLGLPGPARAARLQAPVLEALWTDLASSDASRAFAALRRLCASPDQAVPLIEQRVRPARAVDPRRLAALLADLNGGLERRRQAASELERLGEAAEPALLAALADDPPLDLRQRLERLLSRSRQGAAGGLLRDLRAVEVLELIGNAAARQVLQSLAAGVPGSRLTHQAGCACRRLDRQVAKP
jgi:RNA polymerase sigma factor (sigma-70 family)